MRRVAGARLNRGNRGIEVGAGVSKRYAVPGSDEIANEVDATGQLGRDGHDAHLPSRGGDDVQDVTRCKAVGTCATFPLARSTETPPAALRSIAG